MWEYLNNKYMYYVYKITLKYINMTLTYKSSLWSLVKCWIHQNIDFHGRIDGAKTYICVPDNERCLLCKIIQQNSRI